VTLPDLRLTDMAVRTSCPNSAILPDFIRNYLSGVVLPIRNLLPAWHRDLLKRLRQAYEAMAVGNAHERGVSSLTILNRTATWTLPRSSRRSRCRPLRRGGIGALQLV
jgi:hypothetical protein